MEISPNLSDASQERQRKKRMRVPNSCLLCRRRKVRCDQAKPSCSECVGRGVGHLCLYADTKWKNTLIDAEQSIPTDGAASAALLTELRNLTNRVEQVEKSFRVVDTPERTQARLSKPMVINLPASYFNPMEKVNMYNGTQYLIPFVMRKSRFEISGSFSPIFTFKADIHLRIVWLYMWRYLEKAVRDTMLLDETGEVKSGPMNVAMLRFLEMRKQKVALKKKEKEIKKQPDIHPLILEYFPEKRIIVQLLVRYQKVIYPLIPFCERDMLGDKDVTRIIGGWTNLSRKPTSLDTSQKYDYAYIAILLLLMAITCFTITEEEFRSHPDFKDLKNVNTALYIAIARQCLKKYNIMRKPTGYKVLQGYMLLYYYSIYCPEDDSSSDLSYGKNMLGTLISMTTAIGFHVDPYEISSRMVKENSKFNTWKKLWHRLMELDASSALTQGFTPRFQSDEAYNTLLPETDPTMDDMEIAIVKGYHLIDRKTKLLRMAAATLLQRGCQPTVAHLIDVIDKIQDFMNTEMAPLQQIIVSNTEKVVRLKEVAALFELQSVIFSLKIKLLNHFQISGNTKMITELFFETTKMAVLLLNSGLNLFYNFDRYFGSGYEFVLRPVIMFPTVKALLHFSSLISRCLQSLKLTPLINQIRIGKIKDLQTALLLKLKYLEELKVKASTGYYNSQRMNLGLTYFLSMLRDPSFDFDKAVLDVSTRPLPDDLLRPHDLHGVSPEDVPQSNFLMHLEDCELDDLRNILSTDIANVLQPLMGPAVNIRLAQPIFGPGGGPRIYHFDSSEEDSSSMAAQRQSAKANLGVISSQFHLGKMKILLDDTAASEDEAKTSAELERQMMQEQESATDEPAIVLTGTEFSELVGLFDEFNWINNESSGFDGFGNPSA